MYPYFYRATCPGSSVRVVLSTVLVLIDYKKVVCSWKRHIQFKSFLEKPFIFLKTTYYFECVYCILINLQLFVSIVNVSRHTGAWAYVYLKGERDNVRKCFHIFHVMVQLLFSISNAICLPSLLSYNSNLEGDTLFSFVKI